MVGLHEVRAVGFALAMVALVLPMTGAQAPSAASDLKAEAINVGAPWALDDQNNFTVRVRNNQPTPAAATVTLAVQRSEQAGPLEIIPVQQQFVVIPGSSVASIEGIWDGRDEADNAVTGALTLVLTVTSAAGQPDANPTDNSRQGSAFMRFYGINLMGSSAALPDTPPGQTHQALVQVRNTGNADETVKLSLNDGADGWAFQLSPATVTLTATDPVKGVLVSMTAGGTLVADSAGSVRLHAEVDGRSTIATDLVLITPMVAAAGTLTVVSPAASVVAPPGSQAVFSVRVENGRNQQENVSLRLDPSNASLPNPSIEPSGAVVIPRGGSSLFSVTVQVPAGSVPGFHQWRPFAVPQGFPPVPGPLVTVEVPRISKPALESVQAPASLVPGAANIFRFNFTNQGNAPDAFTLRLVGMPTGWSLSGLSPTPPQIDVSAWTVAEWTLQVPSSSPAGTEILHFVAVSSDGETNSDAVILSRPVESRTAPQLSTPVPRLATLSGQTVEFPFTFRNNGNTVGTFQFSAEKVAGKEKPAGWNVTASPSAPFTLAPGNSATGSVSITAPGSTLNNTAIVNVTAKLQDTASSTAPSSALSIEAFPPMADLRPLLVATTPTTLYKDHPGTVNIAVENRGTAAAPASMLNLVFRRADGTTISQVNLPVEALAAGATSAVQNVGAPTGFATFNVIVTADVDQDIPEKDEDNNVNSSALSPRVFSIKVTPPAATKVLPGEAVAFQGASAFKVTNEGTLQESLQATVTATPAWMAPTTINITIGPGQQKTVNASLLVPNAPGVAIGTVKIVVTPAGVSAAPQREATTLLQVEDTAPPAIMGVRASRDVVVTGEPSTFNATVTDALGVDAVELVLVSAGGAVVKVPMKKNPTTDVWNASTSFDRPGVYVWHVTAKDKAIPPNHDDTSALPGLLEVKSATALALQLIFPTAGTPVKPGAYVVVSSSSAAGIALASYDVDGQAASLPIANPIQVPTLGWTDGTHVLRLHVEGTDGAIATKNFTIQIDGTRPSITKVRLLPAGAQPGENVTVQAEVQDVSAIRSVTLRYVADGPGREIALAATKTEGMYSASFALPVGLSQVFVLAQDQAGNQAIAEHTGLALLESTDVVGSHGAPGLPAPLLLLVLLALASLVTLSRRNVP